MSGYAELAAISNFSFLRGASHPEELVIQAKANGLAAIAIGDRNSLAGVVRAHMQAKAEGIQFIVSCRLVLMDGSEYVCLPTTRGAYGRLCRMLTRGNIRAPKGQCYLWLDDLLEWGEGQIFIALPSFCFASSKNRRSRYPGSFSNGGKTPDKASGFSGVTCPSSSRPRFHDTPSSSFPRRRESMPDTSTERGAVMDPRLRGDDGKEGHRALSANRLRPTHIQGDDNEAQFSAHPVLRGDDTMRLGNDAGDGTTVADDIAKLRDRFPGSVYVGTSPRFDGVDAKRFLAASVLADETGAPLAAVGDCLYHHADRRFLQDVITCIREKCTIERAGFRLQSNAERHLRTSRDMIRLFRGYNDAVTRTIEIAARCRFSLDELKYEYPDEPYEPYPGPQEALEAHTWAGAKEKFPQGLSDRLKAQIAHELDLIKELDYARYFLTVFDLVRYARSQDILCQGRGSAANSAVCFCLGVTSVNPAEIDLLFERFISSERGEPPDIDVDFEHERREEVMQYIYGKYGRHRAGLVATVVTYRDKMAIREAGKALGLSDDVIGALSGMLAWWSEGVSDDDIRAVGLNPKDRTLAMAVKLAGELTGFPRHLSQHTGGFVITRGRLDDTIPIGNAAMDARTMIEWNKDDLDDLGLLKIDVLALGMLTCVRKCFDLVEKHHGKTYALASIPQGDTATYDMICKADTLGVFQIESRAQMSMLPRLRPREFYDLVIEVAIVRPGPIQGDMVHPYLRRRQGLEDVRYESPALEGILSKTLGVPLFQEQCMKIAIVAAGFAPSRADQLRRAMATFKKVGTIHTFKVDFLEGMRRNGYSSDFAERCFAQIQGFGTYGFPESHAASFALLVYVSCYIKCHYPDAFACGLLNSQPMGFYAPAQIVRDFREHGGEVRGVDINHSDWDCTLEGLDPPQPETATGTISSCNHAPSSFRPRFHEGKLQRESIGQHPRCTEEEALNSQRTQQDHHRAEEWIPAFAGMTRGSNGAGMTAGQNGGGMTKERNRGGMTAKSIAHALRLGFRQIKGLSEGHANTIMDHRGCGFCNLEDFTAKTKLPVSALTVLAEADAFRSIGMDRRQALWAISRYAETGTPPALLAGLPLFDAANAQPLPGEAAVGLPELTLGEHVLQDYAAIRMSLKAHPLALLRDPFSAMGYVRAKDLDAIKDGRIVQVSGIVLVRQRPGSAKGVVFVTVEDETGVANLIIWPKTFERFRRTVLGSRLLGVKGKLQKQSGVTHVVAASLTDLTAHMETLNRAVPSSNDFLANADEVRRPVNEDQRLQRRRRTIPSKEQVLPKGRNFH